MTVLFFDLEITGHHVEYIYHLIKYRETNAICPDFVFLTHPNLLRTLKSIEIQKNFPPKGVTILHPTEREMIRLYGINGLYRRAQAELRILNKAIQKHKAKKCYLMSLNRYQLSLGRKTGRLLPIAIRGILFNPFGVTRTKEPKFITKIRKHLQMLWMLRNKKLEHIYILNDDKMALNLNDKYGRKNLFVSIPDPYLDLGKKYKKAKNFRLPESSASCRFLLFGSLSARKGIFLVLDALKQLPENIVGRVEIKFAGNMASGCRNVFKTELSSLKNDRPALRIHFTDDFLPYEQIPNLFLNCDCVLVPYVGSQASSGILGHAAFYKKPVIGPSQGLVGELIRDYDLGITIDSMDKLSEAIVTFTNTRKEINQTKGMQRFVKERCPSKFVRNLISN